MAIAMSAMQEQGGLFADEYALSGVVSADAAGSVTDTGGGGGGGGDLLLLLVASSSSPPALYDGDFCEAPVDCEKSRGEGVGGGGDVGSRIEDERPGGTVH